MLQFPLCCCDKYHDQKQHRGGKGLFHLIGNSSLRGHQVRNSSSNLKELGSKQSLLFQTAFTSKQGTYFTIKEVQQ